MNNLKHTHSLSSKTCLKCEEIRFKNINDGGGGGWSSSNASYSQITAASATELSNAFKDTSSHNNMPPFYKSIKRNKFESKLPSDVIDYKSGGSDKSMLNRSNAPQQDIMISDFSATKLIDEQLENNNRSLFKNLFDRDDFKFEVPADMIHCNLDIDDLTLDQSDNVHDLNLDSKKDQLPPPLLTDEQFENHSATNKLEMPIDIIDFDYSNDSNDLMEPLNDVQMQEDQNISVSQELPQTDKVTENNSITTTKTTTMKLEDIPFDYDSMWGAPNAAVQNIEQCTITPKLSKNDESNSQKNNIINSNKNEVQNIFEKSDNLYKGIIRSSKLFINIQSIELERQNMLLYFTRNADKLTKLFPGRFDDNIIFLSIYIVDLYLLMPNAVNIQLSLLREVAWRLACAFQDKTLTYKYNNFSEDVVTAWEQEILKVFDFDLNIPHPLIVFNAFIKCTDIDLPKEVTMMAQFLLELSLRNNTNIEFSTKLLAVTSFYLSLNIFESENAKHLLFIFTNYQPCQLHYYTDFIIENILNAVNNGKDVILKYCRPEYLEIAMNLYDCRKL